MRVRIGGPDSAPLLLYKLSGGGGSLAHGCPILMGVQPARQGRQGPTILPPLRSAAVGQNRHPYRRFAVAQAGDP